MKKILLLEELNRIEKYITHRDKNDLYNMVTNQQLYYQSHDEAYFKASDRRDEILKELRWTI